MSKEIMSKKTKVSYDICKLCLHSEVRDNWEWFCTKHDKKLDVFWKDKNFMCKLRKPL